MSDEIRTMLVNRSDAVEIRDQALKEGMVTMRRDGMQKVKEEITTPAEVLRGAFSVGR